MKRLLALITISAALFAACTSGPIAHGEIEQEASSQTIEAIDRKADKMRKKILNSKSEVKPSGTIYYVSADGDDANDGLSPRTPIRTLDKMNSLEKKMIEQVGGVRTDIQGLMSEVKGLSNLILISDPGVKVQRQQ